MPKQSNMLLAFFAILSILLSVFFLLHLITSWEDNLPHAWIQISAVVIGLVGAALTLLHIKHVPVVLLLVGGLAMFGYSYYAQSIGDFYIVNWSFSVGKLFGAALISSPFLLAGLFAGMQSKKE